MKDSDSLGLDLDGRRDRLLGDEIMPCGARKFTASWEESVTEAGGARNSASYTPSRSGKGYHSPVDDVT